MADCDRRGTKEVQEFRGRGTGTLSHPWFASEKGYCMKYLKTSDIAKAAGIHPNTVRLYEKWGLLPKIDRSPSGYRLFTGAHLTQVKLIRLTMRCTFFGREVKRTAYAVINSSAAGHYDEAFGLAVNLEKLIDTEYRQAEAAEKFLERWAAERKQSAVLRETSHAAEGSEEKTTEAVSMKKAAALLDITADMLRDWERNGLISIPRNPENGYRLYGPDEINRLRVIRALRRSKYSNMSILRAMAKLESGSAKGLREALDSPELDEDRGYLCFTDNLLTALDTAKDAVGKIVELLKTQL